MRFRRYLRGLGVPIALWVLFVGVLADTLRSRIHADEEYDEDALREWVRESRNFRDTLPERVRDGRIVVDHPQIPSLPPGIRWNKSSVPALIRSRAGFISCPAPPSATAPRRT